MPVVRLPTYAKVVFFDGSVNCAVSACHVRDVQDSRQLAYVEPAADAERIAVRGATSPARAVACAGIEPALSRLKDARRCQLD